MGAIMSQIAVLFGYIILGFVINKVRIFDEVSDKKISSLLVNVTLPATVLASAFGEKPDSKAAVIMVLVIAAVIFILMPFLALLFTRITRSEDTYKLIITYPNLGFMGLPIMSALYGNRAVFFTSMFMIIFNISLFSYGVSTAKGGGRPELKKLLNPGIISSVAALVFFIADVHCPAVIVDFLSGVGSVTSPLAMMLIGSTLARVDFKAMLTDTVMYAAVLYKAVIIPALIWLALRFFITDNMIIGTSVILMSLPVAGNVSMLCIAYGGNKDTAAKATCMSTIFSLIYIPVYMMLFRV